MSSVSNMYQIGSARNIKLGFCGTNNINQFRTLLTTNVLESVKICQNFVLDKETIPADCKDFSKYNFVFYVTSIDRIASGIEPSGKIAPSNELEGKIAPSNELEGKVSEKNLIDDIKNIVINFNDQRNHLFIIIDGCKDLALDDDGDLVFTDGTHKTLYQKFVKELSSISDKLYHLCKISIDVSGIWKKIYDESSIVNLSEDNINLIAPKLIKKSAKMELSEKKREIKAALKKINIDDKLVESGYSELFDSITQYFKLVHQKKIVCYNYLHEFSKISINLNNSTINNINNLLKEIYEINYLKTEMHDELTEKMDIILLTKLKEFYENSRKKVVIEKKQEDQIDAYDYHRFLVSFMDIAKGYNMSNIMEITEQEIGTVNKLIIEHHNKEMEKVTDLDKISSVLEIFAGKDKNNIINLFEKIRSNPKLINENIEKMDKWISFIARCEKIGVPKDTIIRLLEEIIMAKIIFFNDKGNKTDITLIYPLCLQVFLLENINKHFIFKKLYMLITYTIRYSGKNMSDLIKNLKPEQYRTLLLLENKLLELCSMPIDEHSQALNLSDIDIVETFNEKKQGFLLENRPLENLHGTVKDSVPEKKPLTENQTTENRSYESKIRIPKATAQQHDQIKKIKKLLDETENNREKNNRENIRSSTKESEAKSINSDIKRLTMKKNRETN